MVINRNYDLVGTDAVGVLHDLTHYAVETTLGLREAFFGMLSSGRDIDSFGTKDGRKDFYPYEALLAEGLVGLVQVAFVGGDAMTSAEIMQQWTLSRANAGLDAPAVTVNQVDAVRSALRALVERWDAVEAGQSMELAFPSRD